MGFYGRWPLSGDGFLRSAVGGGRRGALPREREDLPPLFFRESNQPLPDSLHFPAKRNCSVPSHTFPIECWPFLVTGIACGGVSGCAPVSVKLGLAPCIKVHRPLFPLDVVVGAVRHLNVAVIVVAEVFCR